MAEISTGSDKMSAFTLATADRGEVTITGVIALGGETERVLGTILAFVRFVRSERRKVLRTYACVFAHAYLHICTRAAHDRCGQSDRSPRQFSAAGNALYPTISELWTVGGGATTR